YSTFGHPTRVECQMPIIVRTTMLSRRLRLFAAIPRLAGRSTLLSASSNLEKRMKMRMSMAELKSRY
ncbi:hypothetical protein PQX77_000819, partial [Marasmius sp. AFHP31]